MGSFLYKMFEEQEGNPKKPIFANALKTNPFLDFFSPFYTPDNNSIVTPKWLERINLAIRLLLSGFDKERKKLTFGDPKKEVNYTECSLDADFALIFKIKRISETEEFRRKLKSKHQDECREFLNKKFRPEKEQHFQDKITKTEVENKLRIAARDESDPEYFVRLFVMWLCAVVFFPDSGTTSFAKKWLTYILQMDAVSWQDHIL
ncbi:hypothetical protein C5167_016505 [Papaver somniferum]|nr:hypothetical protein C5167_016505 [Papaver somniferum]